MKWHPMEADNLRKGDIVRMWSREKTFEVMDTGYFRIQMIVHRREIHADVRVGDAGKDSRHDVLP